MELHPLSPLPNAAVNRLNYDVLSHIFSTAANKKIYEAPWALSGVNRFWRFVAFTTPLLWTNIAIRPDHRIPWSRVMSHIHNSGTCGINLKLTIEFSYSRDILRDVIYQVAPRVRHLDIDVRSGHPESTNEIWLDLSAWSMPILEHFVTNKFQVTHPPGMSLFSSPESLGRVWTQWVTENVTTLKLYDIGVCHSLDFSILPTVLSTISGTLEGLQMAGILGLDSPFVGTPHQKILFPRLTSLDVGFFINPIKLLSLFDAPSLVELSLTDLSGCNEFYHEGISYAEDISQEFRENEMDKIFDIIGSFTTVLDLSLAGLTYPTDNSVYRCFQRLDKLEVLSLFGYNNRTIGNLASVFSDNNTEIPLIPNLMSLSCSYDELIPLVPQFLSTRRLIHRLPRLMKLFTSCAFFEGLAPMHVISPSGQQLGATDFVDEYHGFGPETAVRDLPPKLHPYILGRRFTDEGLSSLRATLGESIPTQDK